MRREVGRRWAWLSVLWVDGRGVLCGGGVLSAGDMDAASHGIVLLVAGVLGVLGIAWLIVQMFVRRGERQYGLSELRQHLRQVRISSLSR